MVTDFAQTVRVKMFTSILQLKNAFTWQYFLWITIFLTLLFTFLNPAATTGASFLTRMIVWFFQIGLAFCVLIATHIAIQKSSRLNFLGPWLKTVISGVLGSLIFTPFAMVIDIAGGLDEWTGFADFKNLLLFILDESSSLVAPITIIWLAVNAPRIMQLNFEDIEKENNVRERVAHDSNSEGTKNVSQAQLDLSQRDIQITEESNGRSFFSFLPENIGKDIIYLKSELHYLRVVSTAGDCLILFNLKDAITQIEPKIKGLQTHRSYWVASKHHQAIVRKKGQSYVRTKQDLLVPISRRNVTNVKKYFSTAAVDH